MNQAPSTTINQAQNQSSGFKRLQIWKTGMEITKLVYEITRSFPGEKRFGLSSQMRRAAVSIPSNIAEGYSRKNDKEFKQFLFIALGSLGELETQILLSKEFGLLQKEESVLNHLKYERAMLLKICHKATNKGDFYEK